MQGRPSWAVMLGKVRLDTNVLKNFSPFEVQVSMTSFAKPEISFGTFVKYIRGQYRSKEVSRKFP